MRNKSLVILLIILVLATVLRTFRLDSVPSSLFGDEVDVGYQAYSILKTGQDLYGQTMPTLIHSLAEYRVPLFIYSDVPFIAIFGLNEWGVRLAAAFWGVLSILGIYLLSKKLLNEKIGLFSAFFLTISPWHLQYSRAGFEVTMLLSFLIFGTYFYLLGLEKKWLLVISAICFGLTPYIYSTAVVFMPLLFILLMILYRKKIFSDHGRFSANWIPAFAGMTLIIILIPYLFQTFSGKAGERFGVISIFSNQDLKDKVLLAKQAEHLPLGLERIFHNQEMTYLQFFTINYLRAFSPEFLFLSGDSNLRQSVQDMGEMYFYELALLLIGIVVLWKGKKWLILGWLLMAPIAASLTFDGGFHATRNFIMLVPLMIILSLGANFLLERKSVTWLRILAGILILIGIFNTTFYLNRYYNDYPKTTWAAWHYGFKEAFEYISQNQNQYSRILVNNTYEPSLIRFLFWTKYDPNKFHREFVIDKPTNNISPGFTGFKLDKYYFGKFDSPFESELDKNTLWVASRRDDITNPETLKDPRVRLLDTVHSPTKQPIFYVLTGINEK